MLPASSGGGAGSYRADPAVARSVVDAADAVRIDRFALSNALADALAAIRNTDDEQTNAVIFALAGIAGDLHDAPARIDARVARGITAARGVLAAIESGDHEMGEQIGAPLSSLFSPARFGSR